MFAQEQRALPYLRAGLPASYAAGATLDAAQGVGLLSARACGDEIDRFGRVLRLSTAQEREIRACAVHACALIAQRTGMTERDIDNALWTRGGGPEYKAVPRHRCRTIYY